MEKSVLIATCLSEEKMHVMYVDSLMKTLNHLRQNNIGCGYMFQISSVIHKNRNELAYQFLNNTQFTNLFFIDSDMSWEVSDFMKVLGSPHDICAGRYLKRMLPQTWTHAKSYLPAGFLCISRKCLEDVAKGCDIYDKDRIGFFNPLLENGTLFDEDYA